MAMSESVTQPAASQHPGRDAVWGCFWFGLVIAAGGAALFAAGNSQDESGLKVFGYIVAAIGSVLLSIGTLSLSVWMGLRAFYDR